MSFRIFLAVFLFLGMSACSSEHARNDAPPQQGSVPPSGSPAGSALQQNAQPRQDPERKKELLARLESIRKDNAAGKRDSEIQTLITELSSLTRALGVTALALDRSGAFAEEIEGEISKFEKTDRQKKEDDAGRIMNGMSGVYGMYALLAKMRFVGQAERQQEIQEIHDETVSALRGDTPAVKAAAAIAEACYALSSMIIRDIDSDHRYDKAFEQIDRQYQQGSNVANKQEDIFINGMFRTFEVSQLWLLSINPKASELITQLNAGVSEDSERATNVGMQMGIAAKYLFQISYLIARDTVQLTL